MGKTKTAFVSEKDKKDLSGADKYKLKQQKKAEKEAVQSKDTGKIRIPGLGGGERVVAISGELPPEQSIDEKTEEAKTAKKQKKIRGNKYKLAKAKIDKTKMYSFSDAVKLVKETSFSKFDGAVELHIVVKRVGLSANYTLPFSAGKEKKVEVASEETIKKLQTGKIDFDVLLATADMMPKLVPFARLLGPRGLMPNPKTGTLLKNISDAKKFSTSTVTVKTEKAQPNIHTVVGKVSQKENELEDNISAVLNAVNTKQIVKAYLKPTMGPSIKLQV